MCIILHRSVAAQWIRSIRQNSSVSKIFHKPVTRIICWYPVIFFYTARFPSLCQENIYGVRLFYDNNYRFNFFFFLCVRVRGLHSVYQLRFIILMRIVWKSVFIHYHQYINHFRYHCLCCDIRQLVRDFTSMIVYNITRQKLFSGDINGSDDTRR